MIFLLYHIKSTENRKTENLYEKNEIKRKAQASISIEKQEEQEIDSSGGKRENYSKPKSEDTKQSQCPQEKEEAIMEALKHCGLI